MILNELFDYNEGILYRALESNTPYNKDTNIFFSENDIYCNFWQFEKDVTHFCFIVGFSGSGKSTLAKKLCKQYNADWAELDVILYNSMNHEMTDRFVVGNQKQRLLMKYIKEKNVDLSYMKHLKDGEKDEVRNIIIQTGKKYVDWLTNINKDKCFISGIDLIDILPMNPTWYSAPIIFKGTSMLKSMVRRYMRNTKDTNISISTIPMMLKWYRTDAHGINYMRNIVINRYNSQERDEEDPREPRLGSHSVLQ